MDQSMTKQMVFTNSHTTPLYSNSWTPSSDGGYAGTCIFLVLLGMTLRLLFAARSLLEVRWAAQARNRRYVVVKGQTPVAERIGQDPNAKEGALVTAQGVEERVKVVQGLGKPAIPFRLSMDIPRAFLTMVIAGVTYLL
jgi:Ctr copper transporter family